MANPDPALPTIQSECTSSSAYTAAGTGKQTNPTGLTPVTPPAYPNNGLQSPGYDPTAVNGAQSGAIATEGTPGPIAPGHGCNN